MIKLIDQLGRDKFAVHSEDRGGTFEFCLAGLYPERVSHLRFCEMALSTILTQQSFFKRENISA